MMRALLPLLVVTSTASAGTHELSIGSAVRALRSDSANALTEDSLGGVALGYAHALAVDLYPGLQLWATGSFGFGTASGIMFQTLDTEVDSLTFAIGGRARYPLRRWLVTSARLELGTTRADVHLRDAAGHSAADAGWGVSAQAALGLEILAMRSRNGFSLGLRFEAGYLLASPVSLTATPATASGDTLRLEMTAAPLGSLDLSGAMMGFAVTSQF
jgi:hypothetical protein